MAQNVEGAQQIDGLQEYEDAMQNMYGDEEYEDDGEGMMEDGDDADEVMDDYGQE